MLKTTKNSTVQKIEVKTTDCSIEKFSSISSFQVWIWEFDENKNIESIDFCKNKLLTDEKMKETIAEFGFLEKKNTQELTYINFRNTQITYNTFLYLFNMKWFGLVKNLQFLDLSFTKLFDYGTEIVTKGLLENTIELKQLNLHQTEISEEGCKFLQTYLNSDVVKSLEFLDLSWNDIQDSGLKKILSSSSKTTNLKDISFEHCGLTSDSCTIFSGFLEENDGIESFNISFNELNDQFFQEFLTSKNIKSFTNLQRLTLVSTKFSEESCTQLGKLLANTNLLSLNLKNNKIRDEGIQILLDEFLPKEKENDQWKTIILENLNFSCCGITEESMEKISMMLVNCSSLISLDLSSNPIKDEGLKKLFSAFESKELTDGKSQEPKSFLKTINISRTKITSDSVPYLVKFVDPKYFELVEFNICWNNIGEKLEDLLKCDYLKSKDNQLLKLNLVHTKMTKKMGGCVDDLLENKNCKLIDLNIKWNELKTKELKKYGRIEQNQEEQQVFFDAITNRDLSKFQEMIENGNISLFYVDHNLNNIFHMISSFKRRKFLFHLKKTVGNPFFSKLVQFFKNQQNDSKKVTFRENLEKEYFFVDAK